MNIFLHQLDVKIKAFMNREMSLCYVRYADDMVFAIQSGADSEGTYEKFRRFFQKALNNLKLSATSLELFREKREAKRRRILVLGLVVSIGSTGTLEIRAPLRQTLSGPSFLGISFDHRVNKLVQHQHHPGCCPSPLA